MMNRIYSIYLTCFAMEYMVEKTIVHYRVIERV